MAYLCFFSNNNKVKTRLKVKIKAKVKIKVKAKVKTKLKDCGNNCNNKSVALPTLPTAQAVTGLFKRYGVYH
ncbi:hypothetical protein G6F42_028734 [Rhizopus arrhizus]|nr:hypothetical protein G6F42_028734 [Rhizopus arrhizus]